MNGVNDGRVATVLFCGGPANGRMMQMPTNKVRQAIVIPVAPASDLGMWQAVDDDPAAPLEIETVRYVHHRVDPSTGLVVYVPEDETRQPPRLSTLHNGYRTCLKCDVRWHGDPVCWCCGADVTNQTPPRRRRGLAR